ncbi:hypothetical protein DES40_2028 [Litorimonas taeanensis]|uniref:Uncharacterized protein n=1 Tax=Litorimonas taeanensis TaxID=568099 RepID=A0A420WDY0_9PROT|nr:hypothetical protein [Litorimonas taeanensis]RKQ69229.1 hypothetical protein DES40_2028 [Litorimonas taeanensis]
MVIITFCVTSIIQGEQNLAFADNQPSTPERLDVKLDESVEFSESCSQIDLDIYFHDQYVTMHSAEAMNDTVERAKDCNVETILVTFIETADAPNPAVKTELMAYLEALEVAHLTETHTLQREEDTRSLNGHAATLSFVMPDLVDMAEAGQS